MPHTTTPPIMRSQQRCREAGLGTDLAPFQAPPLDGAQQQLLALARSSIEDLYQLSERPGFGVLLADAGVIGLGLEGDPEIMALAETCGIRPPVHLHEAYAGTNAVDLALREALPVQTAGEEHYSAHLHPLAFAAAPLFAAGGQAIGALAIVTIASAAHPHTLGLAIAAAQALHNQLRTDQLLGEANDQLAELYATLEAMSEGLIFVGPGDEVRRINRRAADLLGVSRRAVAGRPFDVVFSPPPLVRSALDRREDLPEQELLWNTRHGPAGLVCATRPVWDRSRRYLGALVTLRLAQSVHQLVQRVVGAQARFTFRDIIGQGEAMRAALHQAHLAANAAGSVLLRGEPGVGKEIFAQAIHNGSLRARGPFVGMNCAAVPRLLLAGELFGVEGEQGRPGVASRPGKIELAQGGVLFLEEVDALPLELQTALLRAIEMRRIMRSDGIRPVPIDVRIIATATADLERQVYEGRFRADLYARLSTLSIEIPPLRERGDNDLLLLVTHFLQVIGERVGHQVALAPEALQALRAYIWPGNVRELELLLDRALAGNERSVIALDDLPPTVAYRATALGPGPAPRLDESSRLNERDTILRAAHQAAGNIGRTAAILGVSRATLWRKMQRHELDREDLRQGKE